ncbi:MAG: hypothetical protein H0U15_08720 [Geodermatophilaceae bacterium]|nr:hypothetical protein [Geodermatophilaceae bacterium]
MKRLVVRLVGLYLLLALLGRVAEGMGAVRCGCSEQCWCKRAGPSAFRWVLPYGHH